MLPLCPSFCPAVLRIAPYRGHRFTLPSNREAWDSHSHVLCPSVLINWLMWLEQIEQAFFSTLSIFCHHRAHSHHAFKTRIVPSPQSSNPFGPIFLCINEKCYLLPFAAVSSALVGLKPFNCEAKYSCKLFSLLCQKLLAGHPNLSLSVPGIDLPLNSARDVAGVALWPSAGMGAESVVYLLGCLRRKMSPSPGWHFTWRASWNLTALEGLAQQQDGKGLGHRLGSWDSS